MTKCKTDMIDGILRRDMKKKQRKCVTEVFARPVGYFSPVSRWNKGKVAEFLERAHYDLVSRNFQEKFANKTKKTTN